MLCMHNGLAVAGLALGTTALIGNGSGCCALVQVAHLQEVHEDISDAAARRALEECDGSEDAAAEALADTLFKHRMQVDNSVAHPQRASPGRVPSDLQTSGLNTHILP